MAEMKQKGLKGFGKMGQDYEPKAKPDAAKQEKGKTEGEADETGTKTHTIEEHPDGHFESHMHDGTAETHPDHLHLGAHIMHHLSGGDKHHITHHDGMGSQSHAIHEDGHHDETQPHNSAEDAKQALGNFLDEEAQEPAHQHEEEQAPAYGGMMG